MLKNTKYKIETKDGYDTFDGIVKHEKQNIFRVTLEDDSYIDVTYNHRFNVNNKDVLFKELEIGSSFLETKNGIKMVCDIKRIAFDYVYDIINVNNTTKTFYANGILNHNCEFLGSSSTLVDADVLQRLTGAEPILTKYGYMLRIYKIPEEGAFYIIGVDASKGIGKDSATLQVLKVISERNVEQVATYENNKIEPHNFAQVVIEVSKLYNEAPLMVENNGEGSQVIDAIWHHYEYDKIINYEKKGLGIRSSVKTKLSACLILKRFIENGWLDLNDKETIRQLTFFEEQKPNIFKANGTQHDDLIASLYWAIYFISTTQYDGYGNELRSIEDRFKLNKEEVEDNTAGICIIDE